MCWCAVKKLLTHSLLHFTSISRDHRGMIFFSGVYGYTRRATPWHAPEFVVYRNRLLLFSHCSMSSDRALNVYLIWITFTPSLSCIRGTRHFFPTAISISSLFHPSIQAAIATSDEIVHCVWVAGITCHVQPVGLASSGSSVSVYDHPQLAASKLGTHNLAWKHASISCCFTLLPSDATVAEQCAVSLCYDSLVSVCVSVKRNLNLYSAPLWEARLWSAQVWITQLLHCKLTIYPPLPRSIHQMVSSV